jgi:cytochrome oxidase Cu insertion factor (SCO1/SenC/PrrC family)
MRRIVLSAAAGIFLLASSGCTQANFSMRWKHKQAPGFELANMDGEYVSLSDFRGKSVILTFWGHT